MGPGIACPHHYSGLPCHFSQGPDTLHWLCLPELLDSSQPLEPQALRGSASLFILDYPWHLAIIYSILPWELSGGVPRIGLEREPILNCWLPVVEKTSN